MSAEENVNEPEAGAEAARTNPTEARVREALEGVPFSVRAARDGMLTLDLDVDALHDAAQRLRDQAHFALCSVVTAIDHYPQQPRFELTWILQSIQHADRVRLHVRVDADQDVPTVVDLWPGAAFSERECYDMFGVRFAGHEGLKRLLMPEGYEHFPLRKDFPHQGIEPDKLYREWDKNRRQEAAQ